MRSVSRFCNEESTRRFYGLTLACFPGDFAVRCYGPAGYAWSGPPTPTCSDLATNPAWGLAGNPTVTGLTAVVTPAAGANPAYCQVNFTDGTLVDQIRLPAGRDFELQNSCWLALERQDGGTGSVQGSWNGKIQTLGNGGFAGSVTAVTSATNTGYVGTGTDTGHNSSMTNPVPNPIPPATVQPPPSENGAMFGLNTDGTLIYGRIKDYGWRGQHHANLWGKRIATPITGNSIRGTTTSDAPTVAGKDMKWRSDTARCSTALWPYRQPFTGTVGVFPLAGATMSRTRSLGRTESQRSSSGRQPKGPGGM